MSERKKKRETETDWTDELVMQAEGKFMNFLRQVFLNVNFLHIGVYTYLPTYSLTHSSAPERPTNQQFSAFGFASVHVPGLEGYL